MSREEKRDETAVSRRPFLVLTVKFIRRERSSAGRFDKIHFWRRVLLENRRDTRAPFSGGFENKSPAVVQLDFLRFPSGALVETVWIGIGWIPGTVEPIEIGLEDHLVEGTRIRVYSAARTVVDLFSYRNKVGLDVALEALREGWKSRSFTLAEINRIAGLCRMRVVMKPYLESLTI